MATSLAGIGLLVTAGSAGAQSFLGQNNQEQAKTVQFHREPGDPSANAPSANIPTPLLPASAQVKDKQVKEYEATPKTVYDEAFALRGVREVPGLEVITRLEPERAMFERMKQEGLKAGERIVFPEEPVLSKEPYPGRHWAPKTMQIEPCYVVHGRLLFEQQNFERGLWDLGPLTPLVSAGEFYWDVATLPYHLATRPCQQYDTSAGKCMPGDPTPFFLYPPELSFSGAVAEVAVVTGLFFIFP